MDLAQVFIKALSLPQDTAAEIASIVLAARERIPPELSTRGSTKRNLLSTSSIAEDSESMSSADEQRIDRPARKEKFVRRSKSPPMMRRMTLYLSEVDWRVFFYLTRDFLRNGK